LRSKRSDSGAASARKVLPSARLAAVYGLLVGLSGTGILSFLVAFEEQELDWLPVLLFSLLSLLVQSSSFHLDSHVVHSLAGVIDVAAVLTLGPVGGALVAVLSGLTYLELNALCHRKLSRRYLVEIPLFSVGLKALMALLGGAIYLQLGGPVPLSRLDGQTALAAGGLCLVWFVLDRLGSAIWGFLSSGSARLRLLGQEASGQALLIGLLSLPSGVIVALVYTRLGWGAFGVLALIIVAVAFLLQRWVVARSILVQRVAELSAIEQVARMTAEAPLDVDEICMLMYECASEITDTTIFHLGLFEGDTYTQKLWVQHGVVVPTQTFGEMPGVGLVNSLRESKAPILLRDFLREMDSLPGRPAYVSEDPPGSALYVPLIAGESVIGAMSVQSFRRDAYGDGDLQVLSAMANQAALAIQKARLFAQEHRRIRQLVAIGEVGQQVTATLELDELFSRVVHLVRESFGYYHVSVYTVDREKRSVTFQASSSSGEQAVVVDAEWGQGLVGWVAAHGQPVTVNDVESEARYRRIGSLDETRAELTVPLLVDGEPVGVLDVQSDRADAFGPDDFSFLETLGSQIAGAIQAARLYEAERQQAWLSTALLQVADAMSRVSDMDAVLTSIVRLTPILAGVDRCIVLLWDSGADTFIPAQSHGLTPELRGVLDRMVFPEGALPALDLVRWDRSPLLVNAIHDRKLIPLSLTETFDIQEVVILPLLAHGELVGAMMVDYAGKPHHFSERVIGMLAGIANQAATVIRTARLVEAQREEAYVSMALLQVAEAVSRPTDLDETLGTVARITPMLVGVESCALFLWDRSTAALVPFQQYGLRGDDRSAFWQLCLTEHDPLVQMLAEGSPFVDVQALDRPSELVSVLGRNSLLALPLVTRGETLGMMAVDYAGSAHPFTQRWTNILSGIAGQAAIAVENDRLLEEVAEQERMRQELEVAQRIQASFLPESCPYVEGWDLAAVWRSARQVGGDFYDFIPLPSLVEGEGPELGRIGLVIADVADKGVPAALFMALSRTLVRMMSIDGRPPEIAIARANDLILADARSDLFVTVFYAVLHANSGEIAYVNAGHVPPLVVRAADGTTEELRVPGMALGILPDMQYEVFTTHLEQGDTLVLYTDGITDALAPDQQMFGLEQLKRVVSVHRQQSATELAETITGAVVDFAGETTAQFDDLTLVVAKRKD
jgi:sigma-B regulation protein RsbU (phosphoserine phosphatase)